MAVGYFSTLKAWPQDSGQSLQEFATAIEQLTHCAFPALHEDHFHRGPGRAFSDGMGVEALKKQLLLGSERMVSKAFRQTIKLEVIELAFVSFFRLWKMSNRALWRRLLTAYVPAP